MDKKSLRGLGKVKGEGEMRRKGGDGGDRGQKSHHIRLPNHNLWGQIVQNRIYTV